MTDSADLHDPGGKSHFRLPNGVVGAAEFSDCGKYRYWLTRDWGIRRLSDGRERFVMWVGMNPSTARADTDDQTIRREMYFTNSQKYRMFVKCNVMDYRATRPRDLLLPGVVPCSPKNLETIRFFARKAEVVIVAWGSLPSKLQHHADMVADMLRGLDVPMNCLGTTASGAPRHPSRISNNTHFERWQNPNAVMPQ